MKNIQKFIVFLFSGIGLVACNKVEVDIPVFDVYADALTIRAGDAVRFTFTGDADQITFYSGEPLNDYAYKDGRILEVDRVLASFATNVRFNLENGQPDLLSVWVSSDFSGIYNYEEVSKATWKDNVTRNFAFAPNTMNSEEEIDAVPSGTLDLMSEFEEGKPLYFGFRYKKRSDVEAGVQRNWFVRNLDVSAGTILGTQNLFTGTSLTLVYDHNFPDIFNDPTLYDSNIHNSGINQTTGRLTIRTPSSLGHLDTEVWAISPPIEISEINMGPDPGVPVKGFRNLKADDYTHIYEAPGIYTVTFVASNANIYGAQQVEKQLTIVVIP